MASAGPDSLAECDQIRAVDKARLSHKAGELSGQDLKALAEAVAILLGC